jgi:hypothetical protein
MQKVRSGCDRGSPRRVKIRGEWKVKRECMSDEQACVVIPWGYANAVGSSWMPKGVEHSAPTPDMAGTTAVGSSWMPKGVEH